MSVVTRARVLKSVILLLVAILVPLLLSTVFLPPRNGRITYTRFELFVLLSLLTVAATIFVGGCRAGVRLVVGHLKITYALQGDARRRAWIWIGVAAVFPLLFLYARFVEPYWIEVTHQELVHPGVNSRVRLVVLSDLHSDQRFDIDLRVADRVNELKPDVVLFLGDALNDKKRLKAFRAALTTINAGTAKLAVRGNWDLWYWSGLNLFAGTGFRELVDDRVVVTVNGTRIAFYGHEWEDAWLPKRVVPAVVRDDALSVMLYHAHDYAEVAAAAGFDLYLCGDTHGGQVAIPIVGPLFAIGRFGLRYARGTYDVGNTKVIVNRGLGVERGFPLRLSSRPEIAVWDLLPVKP